MPPDVAEVWLDQLPPAAPGTPLVCPTCGGTQFTAEHREHGVTLACWDCPTFVGICTNLNGARP